MSCPRCGRALEGEATRVCRVCALVRDLDHVLVLAPLPAPPAPPILDRPLPVTIVLLQPDPQPQPDPLPLDDIIKEISMTTRRSPAMSAAVIAATMAASLNVAPDGRVGTDTSKTLNVRPPSDDHIGRPLHGGLGLAQLITLAARRRRARQTHPRKRWRGAVC